MENMIICLSRLRTHPSVFKAMTGLLVPEFEEVQYDVLPRYHQAQQQRLARPHRQRAIGGGRAIEMPPAQQLLLTVLWLRLYPSHEVLGYLFGVSDTTAGRTIA